MGKRKNGHAAAAAAAATAAAAAAAAASTGGAQPQEARSRRPTLSLQKRNELGALVSNLLKISFTETTNPSEEWKQYAEIQAILSRVVALEAPLRLFKKEITAEQRLANIEVFYRWADQHGVKYDGFKIAQFPGYDLGLQATRNITKDEPLFTVPRNLILSEENVPGSHQMFKSMTNIKLAYTLMVEMLMPDSFWKPYIDLLPQSYSTVLYFTLEDMEQLRGSSALSHALRLCKSIARQYAFIYNCSQQSTPIKLKKTPIADLFKEQFSYELYRWAASTVMTRENLIPRNKPLTPEEEQEGGAAADGKIDTIASLIPFWDMANHRFGTLTSFYNFESHQIESTAQADFAAGEQIFMHYGDRSNAQLMTDNGFVDPNNPKDYVGIKLGLSTSDPLYEQRVKLLQLLGIPKTSELEVLPAPDFISAKLLAFVRVFNMNADQLEHWISSERAVDLLHIDCALDTSLESKSWQFLQTRLMLLLRVFPTTLEADEVQLEEHKKDPSTLTYIAAMVLEYRVLEKRILAAALDYAKQRMRA